MGVPGVYVVCYLATVLAVVIVVVATTCGAPGLTALAAVMIPIVKCFHHDS
jgi:hypothetical protein